MTRVGDAWTTRVIFASRSAASFIFNNGDGEALVSPSCNYSDSSSGADRIVHLFSWKVPVCEKSNRTRWNDICKRPNVVHNKMRDGEPSGGIKWEVWAVLSDLNACTWGCAAKVESKYGCSGSRVEVFKCSAGGKTWGSTWPERMKRTAVQTTSSWFSWRHWNRENFGRWCFLRNQADVSVLREMERAQFSRIISREETSCGWFPWRNEGRIFALEWRGSACVWGGEGVHDWQSATIIHLNMSLKGVLKRIRSRRRRCRHSWWRRQKRS